MNGDKRKLLKEKQSSLNVLQKEASYSKKIYVPPTVTYLTLEKRIEGGSHAGVEGTQFLLS